MMDKRKSTYEVLPHRVPMNKQPFSDHSSAVYYGGDENRQRQLDLLMHLVPYGGVVLIIGDSGVGKTTLLEQVEQRASDSCRVCVLKASDCIDPRLALQKMLACFAWKVDVDRDLGGTQIRVLREHVGVLHDNGYTPVLIVDDADAVTDLVFGVIEQLINDDEDRLLTLVLAGDKSLKERLASPLLQSLQGHIAHEMVVSPLSPEEQEDFIRSQLAAAGQTGMGPFHKASLKFINVASGGVPRRIKELAQVIWANKQESIATGSLPGIGAWLKQLRYVLPIILVSGAVAYFTDDILMVLSPGSDSEMTASGNNQDKPIDNVAAVTETDTRLHQVPASDATEPVPMESPLLTSATITAEKKPVEVVAKVVSTIPVVSPGQGGSSVLAVDKPVLAGMPGHKKERAITNIGNHPGPEVGLTGPDKRELALVGGAGVTQESALLSASESPVVDTGERDSDSGQRRSGVSRSGETHSGAGHAGVVKAGLAIDVSRQGDWWLQQDSSRFAVQIMAMGAPAVSAFLQRHAIASEVSIFRARAAEKSLLAVVTGPYATRQAADAAATQWQQQLSGVRPWVRSVASIQLAINNYRDQLQPRWIAHVEQNEQQLLKASPREYAVQLLAMDQQGITKFVSKYEIEGEIEYFRTQTGLYAVLMGRYTSRDQALAAGHGIASRVNGIRPWVRSLSSVQDVIRTSRDRPQ